MKNYHFPLLLLISIACTACISNAKQENEKQAAVADGMSHEGMHHDSSHTDHHDHHHDAMQYAGQDNSVTQLSEDGMYKISLFSNASPIPLQKIHSWTARVETIKGAPVEKIKLFVFGGMPMHRHGFPTKPVVSEHLGKGEFRVDGIKFNMAGHWEMRFNITETGQPAGRGAKDRVVFNIHLK